MVKKNIITAFMLFSLLSSSMTEICLADAASELQQAQVYRQNGNYEQAEMAFKDVVSNYPATDYALKAQRDLVTMYIQQGKESEAQASLSKLKSDFSSNPGLPEALCRVARAYLSHAKYYEQTKNICQFIIATYPGIDSALEAQKYLTILYIQQGKETEAQASLSKLKADFPSNPDLSEALHRVAGKYRHSYGCFEQVRSLYETIVSNYPTTDHALKAQRDLVTMYIQQGIETEAQSSLSKLKADYSSNPDLPAALYKVAEKYRHSYGGFGQARSLYETIVSNYPATDYALKAQRDLVTWYIQQGKETEAQSSLSKLKTDFPSNPDLPEALYRVAGKYRHSYGGFGQARSLYETIVSNYPTTDHALKAQRDLVTWYIQQGIETEAQSSLSKLKADYSSNPDLPAALRNVARKYETTKNFQKAKSIYLQITPQYYESPETNKAQLDIQRIDILPLIESGNHVLVLTAVNQLIVDFSDNPYLPEAITLGIAERYYIKAFELEKQGLDSQAKDHFQKAAEIFEIVINQLSAPDVIPSACSLAGDCFRKLDDYQKSITYYKKVADDYPEHRMAANALLLVGRNYESLKRAGSISKSEADLQIRTAYQQLIEKYPSSRWTKIAKRWLSRHSSK